MNKPDCPRCEKPWSAHDESEEFACRVLEMMLSAATFDADGALIVPFTPEMTADALAAMGEHRQMPGEAALPAEEPQP